MVGDVNLFWAGSRAWASHTWARSLTWVNIWRHPLITHARYNLWFFALFKLMLEHIRFLYI